MNIINSRHDGIRLKSCCHNVTTNIINGIGVTDTDVMVHLVVLKRPPVDMFALYSPLINPFKYGSLPNSCCLCAHCMSLSITTGIAIAIDDFCTANLDLEKD